ncbi:hypothetical protein ACFLRB_00650 [Acidobacteriota bacterium]
MDGKKMNVRMYDSTKIWLYRVAVFAGYLSFFMHGNMGQPLLLMAAAALVLIFYIELKHKKNLVKLLLPFSSGLLCFLMNQFYWDTFDFISRVNGLLLLSLLFSIGLTVWEFDLLRKFLTFFNDLNLRKRLLIIFIFTEMLFVIASGIIVKEGVALGGDEPHYLAISQSLIKDFDLNVFNQYFREGYKEFIDVKKLRAHGAFGKGYKKMYSIHLPGVSITVAPFLLLNLPFPWLYFLIRAYLGLFGALLAVVVYLFSLKLWKSENLSLFITAVFCLTTPVFFHSFHVFPELQALLLILSSLYLLFFPGKKKHHKTLLAGLLLGAAVFWGLKYIIFIYLFSMGFFFYFFIKKKERKRALLFILFPFIFQMLFFSYLYFAYGNFSPMSVYTGMMNDAQAKEYYSKAAAIPFRSRVETLLNYLFDQRDGLLLYNPFYFFAFPGLLIALRKFKTYLPYLLIAIPGFIYILYHDYSTVRPGYCPQARYLVPVIWLFMLFSVIYFREKNGNNQKLLPYSLLFMYSLFVMIYQVLHPFTLYQPTTHNNLFRPGLMFQQWNNLYINITGFLPSFIKVDSNFVYLPNLLFLALFVFLILLALRKTTHPHDNSQQEVGIKKTDWAFTLLFISLFLIFILFPKIPLYNATLVQKNGAQPFKIYGETKRPGRAAEKIIDISGESSERYTVSTINEATFFLLEFVNEEESEIEIKIYNYDKLLKTETLQPLQNRQVVIEAPRFKRLKNLFFYQFTLFFTPRDTVPVRLKMQIFPTKKIGTRFTAGAISLSFESLPLLPLSCDRIVF